MIEYETEQIVPISDAPKYMPGRPCLRSVWRYVLKGINGARLETFKVGNKRFTSVEAIRRFVDGCTNPTATAPTSSSARRQREIAKAEAELTEAGF